MSDQPVLRRFFGWDVGDRVQICVPGTFEGMHGTVIEVVGRAKRRRFYKLRIEGVPPPFPDPWEPFYAEDELRPVGAIRPISG